MAVSRVPLLPQNIEFSRVEVIKAIILIISIFMIASGIYLLSITERQVNSFYRNDTLTHEVSHIRPYEGISYLLISFGVTILFVIAFAYIWHSHIKKKAREGKIDLKIYLLEGARIFIYLVFVSAFLFLLEPVRNFFGIHERYMGLGFLIIPNLLFLSIFIYSLLIFFIFVEGKSASVRSITSFWLSIIILAAIPAGYILRGMLLILFFYTPVYFAMLIYLPIAIVFSHRKIMRKRRISFHTAILLFFSLVFLLSNLYFFMFGVPWKYT